MGSLQSGGTPSDSDDTGRETGGSRLLPHMARWRCVPAGLRPGTAAD